MIVSSSTKVVLIGVGEIWAARKPYSLTTVFIDNNFEPHLPALYSTISH